MADFVGGPGDDVFNATNDADTATGGDGIDTVSYAGVAAGVTVSLAITGPQDTIGAGIDTLSGFENLIGSAFSDRLTGDDGDNKLYGGSGDGSVGEINFLAGGLGNNTLYGGGVVAVDVASYAGMGAAVTVDMTAGGASGPGFSDTYVNIDGLEGSAYGDTLTGNAAGNYLYGLAGDDTLYGAVGSDRLYGGTGLNRLYGGPDNDTFFVGQGTDFVYGGKGTNLLDFTLSTTGVTAALPAGQASTSGGLVTFDSIVQLRGTAYGDLLTGDSAANFLDGQAGNDILYGGDGVDSLYGGGGSDQMYGGNGDDLLLVTAPGGATTAYGGSGVDTLNLFQFTSPVTLHLDWSGPQSDGAGGSLTLDSIEKVIGGSGDDVLFGGAGDQTLGGGPGGNDYIDGGAGIDTVDYGFVAPIGTPILTVDLSLTTAQNTGITGGIDTLIDIENVNGSNWDDTLLGSEIANRLDGRAGADELHGRGGDDVLIGGAGNSPDADQLYGEDGNDNLDGGGGADLLDGGAGRDTANYATATAAVVVNLEISGAQNTGGSGTDTLVSIENLIGSAFNDTLTGNGAPNVIEGGAGNDVMEGGGNTDTASYAGATAGVTVSLALFGAQNTVGAGSDTLSGFENLTGSAFGDTLAGYFGPNVLAGMDGDDLLAGGSDGDTLDGGAGSDTASYAQAGFAVTVNLAVGRASGPGPGDRLISIENAVGSAFGDVLVGDDGANSLSGGNGDDILQGAGGNDLLDGGAGTDTAAYYLASAGVTVSLAISGPQNTGGAGTDTLVSIENLEGSAFNDTLTGDDGANGLYGDTGDDLLYGGAGNDSLDGGAGSDTAVFTGASSFYVVTALGGGSFSVTDQVAGRDGTDILTGVEFLQFADITYDLSTLAVATGTAGADTLHGSAAADLVYGGGGDDLIDIGTPGVGDRIFGGGGTDTVSYASSTTAVAFAAVFAPFFGPSPLWMARSYDPQFDPPVVPVGQQILMGLERVIGSDFRDFIAGGDTVMQLYGGGGNDTVQGNGELYGGEGNDALLGGLTSQLYGGAGDDVLTGGGDFLLNFGPISDLEQLFGGDGNDRLQGGVGDDLLDGGAGEDTADYSNYRVDVLNIYDRVGVTIDLSLSGPQQVGFNSDTLVSIENLTGSSLNDRLTGNASNNRIDGAYGDDVIQGGAGDDTLDGGSGTDTASYGSATAGVTVSLARTGAQDTLGAGIDTLTGFENLTGSAFADHLTGDGGANVLTGGAGNDVLDGGGNVDTAVFSGAMSAYTITSNGGTVTVVGPDGTDTLTNIEFLQFSDQTFHFRPGTAATVDFTANPSTYAAALRDFDGNDLGGAGSWVLAGHVDIQGDGDQEYILFNSQIGRWATIGPAADGKVYFDDHGWAGDTRVVGIYIDPEVVADPSKAGGPYDSQRRFQNDLNIGNLKGILGAGDYNHDGLQEVYFSLTDGTAYLHAYMHADGNIQYANYQSQQQVIDYLTANGFNHTTWDGWF